MSDDSPVDHDTSAPDSPAPTAAVADDDQLKIRIPNPKVYMSQWKGQRGKPRCDYCRESNLKCDRVLPRCNHCSLGAGKECKYTPLPTPAHRGIPRCDRCRMENLKCDRTVPACNFCVEYGAPDCNYTPKKRQRIPPEQVADSRARRAEAAASAIAGSSHMDPEAGEYPSNGDSAMYDDDDVVLVEDRRSQSAYSQPARPAWPPPVVSVPPEAHAHALAHAQAPRPDAYAPHAIVPWFNKDFASLPKSILQRMAVIDAPEMPPREMFEDNLARFLYALDPRVRETSVFELPKYAQISQAVVEQKHHMLREPLHTWVKVNHVGTGSLKINRLTRLREDFMSVSEDDERLFRKTYIEHADAGVEDLLLPRGRDRTTAEWARPFERIPIQPQIFDLLVYGHRHHYGSHYMVFEIRRAGFATITWAMAEVFVKLCPTCRKYGVRHPARRNKTPMEISYHQER